MDPFTTWLIAHPWGGAFLFLVPGILVFVFFGEMSDGSRGGDASGKGRINPVGIFISLSLILMAFFCIMGWVE